MVPDGWKKGTFAEGITLISGQHVEAHHVNEFGKGKPYLTGPADFPNGTIIVSKYTDQGRKFSQRGDILITVKGSGTGKVIESDDDYAISRQLMAIRATGLDPRFTYYNVVFSLNRYEGAAAGLIPGISREDVLGTPLLIPPLPEQKKIAQILSTWDNAISATERLLENSQQRKKGLMQQLLTGKKRLPGFEGEWKYVEFSDAFMVANQKACQVKATDYKNSGTLPIVDQGKKLVSAYTNSNTPYTDLPVIIFGDHTRVFKWVDFIFCPGADGTQVLKAKSHLDPKFSYFAISNIELPNLGYSRHMRELKERDFKIPLDIDEQQAIANVLTTADQEIDALQKRLDHLKQEKKALMQQLLTGKRRVQVDDAA